MKISLIICAYNEEKFIGTCLDYAIKSGKGRFHEIIVIDNVSTDRTAEIAASKPGVRVVREDKKGLVVARQRGYMESIGEILAYIDADTQMPENWYDKVEQEYTNDKDGKIAVLSGPYFYYDLGWWNRLGVKIYWTVFGMPTYWMTGYMVVGGNFAIRRTTLDKMNGFDTSITFYGEDTNIARRASKFGRSKFTLGLTMNTSGRRLEHHGTWTTGWVYVLNYFSEVFLKKPITKTYKDIR